MQWYASEHSLPFFGGCLRHHNIEHLVQVVKICIYHVDRRLQLCQLLLDVLCILVQICDLYLYPPVRSNSHMLDPSL